MDRLIKEVVSQEIYKFLQESMDFVHNGDLYSFQHGTTPHKELPNFHPKLKPMIMYKQFKLRLDKNGNNLAKGFVFPLYVNTEEEGKSGVNSQGLKLGVWYKSGEGSCWINTSNGRSYTRGKGYGTDGQTIDILAYRPGWHLTTTPWGNQRGANKVVGGPKGTGNNYRNTWNSEVWAKVEICVDVNATELAKQRAIQLKQQSQKEKGKKYKSGSYDAKEACLDKLGEDYYYLYKTNSNASDDQSWFIVDKIRIVSILDDDSVDSLNDTFYANIAKKTNRKINSDPMSYVKPKNEKIQGDIPYWKMPRENGVRYTKDDLRNMGYEDQPLSKGNWT